ncbi:MAG: MGMT family protein [Patescibacteria group bacterium]|nr:MGMT family protein [Patescibacteria group bacterium]
MRERLTDSEEKVIEKLRGTLRGKVTTYGFLARALDRLRVAWSIDNAVGKNPFASKVHCYRVVKTSVIVGVEVVGLER